MAVYRAIGVMSGTSLDGLDIVCMEFVNRGLEWSFEIIAQESIAYETQWQNRLSQLSKATALEFVQCHVEYGHLLGHRIADFIGKYKLEVDVIALHGHTIFHQPDKGFTSQIGDGAAIAAITQQIVACDFRSMDVARGGQGAPLVPIGDALLFNDYVARINLGGFSNISFGTVEDIKAFDICPVNIIMNEITRKKGLEYDDKGDIARGGRLNQALLEKLNQLDFYKVNGPKSLGKEWLDEQFWPLLDSHLSDEDLLRTLVEHISDQIALSLASSKITEGKVLVTGGGAYNDFLMERIQAKTAFEIIIPKPEIIEMKEALIFAFLGILRLLGQSNILSDVTGAQYPSIGGSLYDGRIS